MGVRINLVSKKQGESKYISQGFENLIASYDDGGYESELGQIGDILALNLENVIPYPKLLPDTDKLEYELYLAEEEGNESLIIEIENKIEKLFEKWEEERESNIEGWIPVKEYIQKITHLKETLLNNPSFIERLKISWFTVEEEYFIGGQSSPFLKDLDEIIKTCIKLDNDNFVGYEWA